jgi:hypothetical protein
MMRDVVAWLTDERGDIKMLVLSLNTKKQEDRHQVGNILLILVLNLGRVYKSEMERKNAGL